MDQSASRFVEMDNYPVFNLTFGQHYFGGESVQQTLLARAFCDIGYDVSMIVMDYGQLKDEVIEGIRVLRIYDPTAGIPVLRFFHPRASSIISTMEIADADVYCYSFAGMITGLVARFCRANDRKFRPAPAGLRFRTLRPPRSRTSTMTICRDRRKRMTSGDG